MGDIDAQLPASFIGKAFRVGYIMLYLPDTLVD
jgi:hypothetical protein